MQIQIIRLFYKHFTPFGPSSCSLKGCEFSTEREKSSFTGRTFWCFLLRHVVKCGGKRGHEICRGDGGNEKKKRQIRGNGAEVGGGRRGGNFIPLRSINTETRERGKWRKHARRWLLYSVDANAHSHAFADSRPWGRASIRHFIHIQMSSPIHSPPPLQSMLHLVKPLCSSGQKERRMGSSEGAAGKYFQAGWQWQTGGCKQKTRGE